MNIVLLSGGSGRRLWPLSNEVRSKQFLKVFSREDGTRESMVQRMYRMIKEVDHNAFVTIATSENQIPQIKSQLGEEVCISVEPSRRDTFPAIVLAACCLKEKKVCIDEPVIFCPVDPYVDIDYFKCLKKMSTEVTKDGAASIILMGIEPTYPSTKYGYILPEENAHLSMVSEFKEKPDEKTAKQYIEKGALWNSGVFALKLSYILGLANSVFGTDNYVDLLSKYDSVQKTSFDYAVVEKEKSKSVIRFKGAWKDLGTWNTLSEAMTELSSGNVRTNDCINTHVINELGIPLVALGIKNSMIVATPDGILVADKDVTPQLKEYAPVARPMYERRAWGEYRVLDYKAHNDGKTSMVTELIIDQGRCLSCQAQGNETKAWTVIRGKGELLVNRIAKVIRCGDTIDIKPKMGYEVKAVNGELHIIEVRIGDIIMEDDVYI